MLRAQGHDKLLVGLLLASLVEDAHVCLATIESLGGFAETARETVVHERELENALQRIENRHLTLGRLAGDFDLILHLDSGGFLFYVRLGAVSTCLVCVRSLDFSRDCRWGDAGLKNWKYIPSCMAFRLMSKDPRSGC